MILKANSYVKYEDMNWTLEVAFASSVRGSRVEVILRV